MRGDKEREARDRRRIELTKELGDVRFAAKYARMRAAKPQLTDEQREIATGLARQYEQDAEALELQLA